jgi:two-component system, NtrC family, response regulator HydG
VEYDEPTVLAAEGAQSSKPATGILLRVVDGPDSGKVFALDTSRPARALIGKSKACDLVLGDPLVSRRHCAVEVTPRGLRVVDLGSSNGTRVGQKMSIVDAYVAPGEQLTLGKTRLAVEEAAPHTIPATELTRDAAFGRVVGGSLAMRKLYGLCARLAASNVPVVIEGETGTGKELLAEALHEEGPRAGGPFVVFDCTAVPPTLAESTLFGHERGAFTSAVSARKGVFEQAQGGTLLIDEIGDLDAALQPKLLRALERGEVQRVGGQGWLRSDARVLAATRRDLEAEVQAGRFREDLYYRLAVARLELPPLRERQGDVALLFRRFWRDLDTAGRPAPEDFVERLEAYRWPGNVRELRNVIAHRIALGDLAVLPGADSPSVRSPHAAASNSDFIQSVLSEDLPLARAREQVVAEFERLYVERVLARFNGNVTRAAEASGVARRHFYSIKNRSRP